MKITVEIEVDVKKINELETTIENELEWLADSGMTVLNITEEKEILGGNENMNEKMVELNGVLTCNGVDHDAVFKVKESDLEEMVNDKYEECESIADFLDIYTHDDTQYVISVIGTYGIELKN